ncbi:thyrotropin-releasing hormone-degrading ectoenzyme [Halyomorpha halys]|uniref:thyrotropin-releasing hormone-degrading ectoenzyme n=1 Tax=Halyomorpha halys TaxID=286706 RepID=UPI0034D1F3C6
MKKRRSIQIKFNFDDTWIIFNPQYSGLVRINYSTRLWKLIISGLRKGTTEIPSLVKAQLLDDAFALASEGSLDYSIPMTLALYLKNEEEYTPWFVALKHLSNLAEVLINYPEWQIFQQYMTGIMSDITPKLQIKNRHRKVEKEIQGQLRKILMGWSCMNGLPDGCDKWTLQQFLKWKDDPSYFLKSIVPTELKSIIYCTGAKLYDDEVVEYMYSFSKTHMFTSGESLRLLRGVTCTSKIMSFMEILNEIFDTNNPEFSFLRLREFVLSLKQSPLNSLLSYRYIKYHWKTLYEQFHESNGIMSAIIEGTTYVLRTKEHYYEVLTIRKSVPESDYNTLVSIDHAIDRIIDNINWDTRNLHKFRKWLKFYNSTPI